MLRQEPRPPTSTRARCKSTSARTRTHSYTHNTIDTINIDMATKVITVLTPEHRHARNGAAVQVVVGLAVCLCSLDQAGPMSTLVVLAGILLALSSPSNLAWRASVNWWICVATAFSVAFFVGFSTFIASGGLASLIDAGGGAPSMCRMLAREAQRGDSGAEINCQLFKELRQLDDEMFVPLDGADHAEAALEASSGGKASTRAATTGCRADCLALAHALTDDSWTMLKLISEEPVASPVAWILFLVCCAWISSRASTKPVAGVGEPQDLPQHRMAPTDAIASGMRKSFTKAGRASRSEYWCYMVFGTAMLFASAALRASISGWQHAWMPAEHHPDLLMSEAAEFLSVCLVSIDGLLTVVLVVSLVSATVRRLHDTGRSGWRLILLPLALGVPALAIPFWLMRGSEERRNAHGPVPTNGSWRESSGVGEGETEGCATAVALAAPQGEPQDLPEHWMSPIDAVASGVSKSFTKAGRASRSEYWWYLLFGPGVLLSIAALGDSEPVREIRHAQMPPFLDELQVKLPSDLQPLMNMCAVSDQGLDQDRFNGDLARAVDSMPATLYIWGSIFAFETIVAIAVTIAVGTSFLFATVRRLHDTDRSGWRLVLLLVPVLNVFMVFAILFWLMQGSAAQRNAFGPVPANGSWRGAEEKETQEEKETEEEKEEEKGAEVEPEGSDRHSCDCENPLQAARERLPQHLRHAVD
jgi:uncharacterized membrane protein YhaH (DUF805 family)